MKICVGRSIIVHNAETCRGKATQDVPEQILKAGEYDMDEIPNPVYPIDGLPWLVLKGTLIGMAKVNLLAETGVSSI